jgi:regulator of protease activity HflC (stomatin/prohibitin superfamily)
MTYTIVVLAILLGTAVVVLLGNVGSTTVFEYERGLRFVRGKLAGELGSGLYRYLRPYTTIVKVDTRLVQLAVNGQEVLSRDGVAVKASLSASYQVIDVRAATFNSDSYVGALYIELQQALRTTVSATDIETLLESRAQFGPAMLELCQPAAGKLGLRLESIAIRDLTLPGELKKIFAQVVKARQEGLAALERARGETAALRSLANAAQMVERNPYLFQLRLLQVAGQQTGTTLVMGMPQGTATIPIRGGLDVGAIPPETQSGDADE